LFDVRRVIVDEAQDLRHLQVLTQPPANTTRAPDAM
jgi:hypothetical protein